MGQRPLGQWQWGRGWHGTVLKCTSTGPFWLWSHGEGKPWGGCRRPGEGRDSLACYVGTEMI